MNPQLLVGMAERACCRPSSPGGRNDCRRGGRLRTAAGQDAAYAPALPADSCWTGAGARLSSAFFTTLTATCQGGRLCVVRAAFVQSAPVPPRPGSSSGSRPSAPLMLVPAGIFGLLQFEKKCSLIGLIKFVLKYQDCYEIGFVMDPHLILLFSMRRS